MIIYYLLWGLLLLPGCTQAKNIQNKKKNEILYYIVCLTIVMGLKSVTVGADTSQYLYRYEISDYLFKTSVYEQGYNGLTYLCNSIGISFRLFLLLYSAFVSTVLVIFYSKKVQNLSFGLFLFLTIGIFPMYMSGIRQTFAISFCLIALLMSEKKKTILSVVFVLIASNFHVSAVIFLLAIILSRASFRFTKRMAMLLILLASAALFYKNFILKLAVWIIPEKYAGINLSAGYNINKLLIIIAILIPIFCVAFLPTENDARYSHTTSLLFVFSCINISLCFFSMNSMYFSRLSYYFVHANPILIASTIYQQKRRNKVIMYFTVGLVAIVYFIISIPGGTLQIDNYSFFWQ